jgi:hypothetical protein
MTCLIQLLLSLGLTVIGLGVLMGLLKPAEVLQKIGALLVFLLLGPAVAALLVKEVVVPAATAVWSATKQLLIFGAVVLGLLLIVWLIAGLVGLYRNRNSGEHHGNSGEE